MSLQLLGNLRCYILQLWLYPKGLDKGSEMPGHSVDVNPSTVRDVNVARLQQRHSVGTAPGQSSRAT